MCIADFANSRRSSHEDNQCHCGSLPGDRLPQCRVTTLPYLCLPTTAQTGQRPHQVTQQASKGVASAQKQKCSCAGGCLVHPSSGIVPLMLQVITPATKLKDAARVASRMLQQQTFPSLAASHSIAIRSSSRSGYRVGECHACERAREHNTRRELDATQSMSHSSQRHTKAGPQLYLAESQLDSQHTEAST